jgi:hypothetical protein
MDPVRRRIFQRLKEPSEVWLDAEHREIVSPKNNAASLAI